jgi:hypothetical protein
MIGSSEPSFIMRRKLLLMLESKTEEGSVRIVVLLEDELDDDPLGVDGAVEMDASMPLVAVPEFPEEPDSPDIPPPDELPPF